MNKIEFITKPFKIEAIRFMGETGNVPEWLNICGIKLPKGERVGKFWNKLHDSELEVEYGDWIVCHDLNDLYPIKNDVLKSRYKVVR